LKVTRLGDPYLPGPQTLAGQEIRLAAGVAGWIRRPRRLRGFGGPMLAALMGIALVAAVALMAKVV
jgi:hypothetical protein